MKNNLLPSLLPFEFKGMLFVQLFVGFIMATFIGVITVYGGAIIMAKLKGVEIRIHYNGYAAGPGCRALHTNWDYLDSIQKKYPEAIKSNAYFPDKQKYAEELLIRKTRFEDSIFVGLGTILLPLIIGTLGLLFLFHNRRKQVESTTLKGRQWILIFLSLFWLRAVIDCWMKLYTMVFTRFNYYSFDTQISYYLKLGREGLPIIECCIGTTILCVVIFRFIPKEARLTFLLSGLIGGITGLYLWLFLIGKHLLP